MPTRAGRLTPKFLSTPSARRATFGRASLRFTTAYFYPRPPRGGRLLPSLCLYCPTVISIHALREEGDVVDGVDALAVRISIHALREEGDLVSTLTQTAQTLFLSTPSARRATNGGTEMEFKNKISIHALREEGDQSHFSTLRQYLHISIHALREEGDRFSPSILITIDVFLSTPSARRATIVSGGGGFSFCNFYPRPPRGGRLTDPENTCPEWKISIHALREEGDMTYLCRTSTK